MSICNPGRPITNSCSVTKQELDKLIDGLLLCETDSPVDLAVYLNIVRHDPSISISITPVQNEYGETMKSWYFCEITSGRYKPLSFNVEYPKG